MPVNIDKYIEPIAGIIDTASDRELLDLAVTLALMAEDAAMIGQINTASIVIGRHADELARENIPQRSDGSFIYPYAPDGGALRVVSDGRRS